MKRLPVGSAKDLSVKESASNHVVGFLLPTIASIARGIFLAAESEGYFRRSRGPWVKGVAKGSCKVWGLGLGARDFGLKVCLGPSLGFH